jgi:hypothetical protein
MRGRIGERGRHVNHPGSKREGAMTIAPSSIRGSPIWAGVEGPEASSEVNASLSRAHELVRHLSARSLEAHIHLMLAELAPRREDEAVWRNELTEAHRLFTEIGASGHAERVAGELVAAS